MALFPVERGAPKVSPFCVSFREQGSSETRSSRDPRESMNGRGRVERKRRTRDGKGGQECDRERNGQGTRREREKEEGVFPTRETEQVGTLGLGREGVAARSVPRPIDD